MKLRWRNFERAMGARVKQFDARREMLFWQKVAHYLNSSAENASWAVVFLMRGFVSAVFVTIAFWNDKGIQANAQMVMAWTGWWGVFASLLSTGFEWDKSNRLFPFTQERLFREEIKQKLMISGWVALEFLVIYWCVLFAPGRALQAGVIALSAAVIQWVLSVALGAFFTALRLNLNVFLVGFLALAGVLLFTSPEGPLGMVFLNLVFGWVNYAIWHGFIQEHHAGAWFILPMIAWVATFPYSFRTLKRLHHTGFFHDPARLKCRSWRIPLDENFDAHTSDDKATVREAQGPNRTGFVDRLIERFLTPKDRDILEMLELEAVSYTRLYWKLLSWTVLFCGMNLFVPNVVSRSLTDSLVELIVTGDRPRLWTTVTIYIVTFLTFAILVLHVMSFFLRFLNSPERNLRSAGNRSHGYQAFRLFPVNYWTTQKAVLKFSAVLVLLLIPPMAVVSICPIWAPFVKRLGQSALFMIKLPICLGMLTLFGAGARMLPGTDREWKALLYMCRDILLLGLFFGMMGLFVAAPSPWEWALGPVFAGILYGWVRWCGAGYRRDWKG